MLRRSVGSELMAEEDTKSVIHGRVTDRAQLTKAVGVQSRPGGRRAGVERKPDLRC